MKKQTYILLLFLMPISVFAQFAELVDKDGFVNVRASTNANSKVIARIKSREIVFISNTGNENENWSKVDYQQKKGAVFPKYISGFVHNSRLKKINQFLLIPSLEDSEKGTSFECCGVDVVIKSGHYDFQKDKKNFVKRSGYYTFKGKYAFGAWGVFPPSSHYLSISGNVAGVDFTVPTNEIDNLFMVNNESSECYYNSKDKILYIVLSNANGSDSYQALITIERGKYKSIIVTGDN